MHELIFYKIVIKHLFSDSNFQYLPTDADTSLTLNGSCSIDLDLDQNEYGPNSQGIQYEFECWRPCQSEPAHDSNSARFLDLLKVYSKLYAPALKCE